MTFMRAVIGRKWLRVFLETMLVGGLIVSWLLSNRSGWWGVPHHAAQTLGDSTILALPASALIGGGWALSQRLSGLHDLADISSRRQLGIWGSHLFRAILPTVLGGLFALACTTVAVAAVSGSWAIPIFHSVATLGTLAAGAAIGFVSVRFGGHPAVAVAAAVLCLVLPRSVAFFGDAANFGQAFVADELVLGTSAKSSSYLFAQAMVPAAVIAACLSASARYWSTAVLWLALAFGAASLATTTSPLEPNAEYAEPVCAETNASTICVAAIHEYFLDDVVELFSEPVRLANEIEPTVAVVEEGATLRTDLQPSSAGVTVLFTGRYGFDDQADLLDEDLTLAAVLPRLAGVEQCQPFVIPDEEALDLEPGDQRQLTLTPQGEVYLWLITELEQSGSEVVVDDYLAAPYVSTGLAQQLDRLSTAERQNWFEQNRESLVGCEIEIPSP